MHYRRALIAALLLACGLFVCFSGSRRQASDTQPPRADAIVLLAGDYQERAPVAARLYCEGYAPRVLLTNDGILSGWSSKYNRNLYTVEWTEEELVESGVPRERITRLPYFGSSTMYDALVVRRHVRGQGMKSMIIVTTGFHLGRALWTFRKVFSGLSVEFSAYPAGTKSSWRRTCVLEYCKTLYYRVMYGLFGLVPELDWRHYRRAGANT